MIKCDNMDCGNNNKGVCKLEDIELEKTWAGTEKWWTLRCYSSTNIENVNKYRNHDHLGGKVEAVARRPETEA